ncbi:MAG: 50S ribosomal protein L22 [Pyrinomonadaceae bacterium]|nr:50S ribosomal protein L22 [Pyrinomonadaceae bacterium]
MEAIAKGKFLRGSPQKTRLVIDMIRGKNVAQALAVLKFTDKRATENIEKCLRSAIANATNIAESNNVAIDPDDLWVKTCFVDQGPSKNRRRVRPAPQGRAYREKRYYCHITIQVTSDKPEGAKDKREVKVKTTKPRVSPNVVSPKAKDEVTDNVTVVDENVNNAAPVETVETDVAPVETVETEKTNVTEPTTIETTAGILTDKETVEKASDVEKTENTETAEKVETVENAAKTEDKEAK